MVYVVNSHITDAPMVRLTLPIKSRAMGSKGDAGAITIQFKFAASIDTEVYSYKRRASRQIMAAVLTPWISQQQ